jgi:hypothetical protein
MAEDVKFTKVNLYEFLFANKTRKTYTTLALTLVLVIVLLTFALRPTLLTVSTIKEKIKEYDSLNTLLEKKVAASQILQSQMNTSSTDIDKGLKDEIDFLGKVFQGSYGLKSIYLNILKRADTNKIIVSSITPNYQSSGAGGFENLPASPSDSYYSIDIVAAGNSLEDIQNWAKSLETSVQFPIFSRLSSFSILKQTDSLNQYGIKLSLIIYLDQTKLQATTAP